MADDPNLNDDPVEDVGDDQVDDEQTDDNEPDPDAAGEGQDDDPAAAQADDDDPDVSRETVDVQPGRRQRARDRIRASREEVQRERSQREALERQLAEERANRTRTSQAADEQREQQLLASMDENQKTQYLLAKEVKRTQERQAHIEQQIFDSNDRSNFIARTARDTRAARLQDKVEQTYQQLRSQLPPTATPISREVIYYALLGQQVANASPKGAAKQRAAGQRRIADARGNGASLRNDAAAPRRGGKTAEERLEGVLI